MSSCQKCGNNLQTFLSTLPNKKPGRQDSCPKCHNDLKSCLNCNFYDSSRKWECKEDISERVADKEKSNFCDFFDFRDAEIVGKGKDALESVKSKAESLFKTG